MKITKESIGIIAGSVIVFGGITWLVVNSIRNKKIVKRVNFLIDNNITEQTYATNFFSSAYQTALQGKNYIVMPRTEAGGGKESVGYYMKQLKAAIGLVSDNEDAIFSVFRALKDGVAVNQVALAYQTTYGKNLLEQLQSSLNKSEFKKLIEILDEKPPYGIKE